MPTFAHSCSPGDRRHGSPCPIEVAENSELDRELRAGKSLRLNGNGEGKHDILSLFVRLAKLLLAAPEQDKLFGLAQLLLAPSLVGSSLP